MVGRANARAIECTILEYRMPFGQQITSEVQGSGFVYEYEGEMIIITNNNVVEDANSITITFADENTYDAEVIARAHGQVIGITTAIVSYSDGLGFAVPSDTILSLLETFFA